VYEAGELKSLSSSMVGWEIELESVDTKRLEAGVVKQVDCDINCALVLFPGGRKEWLDLTFFRFKVPGHQVGSDCANGSPSPSNKHTQSEAWQSPKKRDAGVETSPASEASSPSDFSLVVSPLSMPRIAPDEFEWHLEGTHVELCDPDGHFLEGAALCSKTESHLQLYSESRGFFETACSVQGFKVVIHGLESLKTFPMGQTIDVYSPLLGRFRGGTVLKAAVLGHLTPVRFATNTAVEWIDLKSQTFKLVFLPLITDAFEHLDERQSHVAKHSPHRSHGPDSHRGPDLVYPQLHEGQGIEIFDDFSKQYLKYKVAAQSNWSKAAYIFEPLENAGGGLSSRAVKHVVSSLSKLRSRLLLQPGQWENYRGILAGHRVDVYDRVGKSVMNGKIIAVGGSESTSDTPTVMVRFKDGHQAWVDLRTNKVKLRMHPAAEVASASGPTTPVSASPRVKNTDSIEAPTSAIVTPSSELGTSASTTSIPVVHPKKSELAQSKSDQTLFRIPCGAESEELESTLPKASPTAQMEVSAAAGSPGRRPSAGKRVPALHRRASQSADVPKTPQPLPDIPLQPDPALVPATSPTKEENPATPATTATKPLGPVQSPRLGDASRPLSPGGSLPSVQPSSNPNSPSKMQLPVGPVQAAREPNLDLVASDHGHPAS